MASNNNRSYRVKANVGSDKVLNVQLNQDIDFLEILSLKLDQKDLYKLHTSNYGMLVGRVLANDAFGIPNVKLSIFIELTDADKQNVEIENLYPYRSTSSRDRNGVRYNLLPDSSNNDCYRIVGTFPNKRLVLDDNNVLEVFDRYWKYTTVTNQSGDYFIPCVPCGNCEIHVDFDISDIGILSQRPRDMIYKGYNMSQFDNANQFKESTNLDNLSQIFSQNQSVYVYPFWGEENIDNIAITRCDIQIQYKFEPTCVFIGSIMTDTASTAIGHNCKPFRDSGYNKTLVPSEGTIEMIRKTPDGFIEEFQIQGNRLIDGDGVWCYQIPMNLDYVQTDEFGNIIPTDNPKKGIPTRTDVRFRVSIQETDSEGVSRHRAKYLVPNNPTLDDKVDGIKINKDYKLNTYYEFGTATNDDSFRSLFWNKVYTVKNYIPRLQISKKAGTKNYIGIRTTNYSESNNPAPFNKIRLHLSFTYRLSCILATILLKVVGAINATFIYIIDLVFEPVCKIGGLPLIGNIFKWACKLQIPCIEFPFVSDDDEGSCAVKCYFPSCTGIAKKVTLRENKECDQIESSQTVMKNKVEQKLAEENESVNLDFYNDWLNGALYMPLWFWKKRRKKKFFFGLFSRKAVNTYCNCTKRNKVKLFWPCSFGYNEQFEPTDLDNNFDRWHDKRNSRVDTNYGIIKENQTLSGLNVYYYAPGVLTKDNNNFSEENRDFALYFATDIVLIGSLSECDLDGVPQMFKNLPSTTANLMPVNRDVEPICDTEDDADVIHEITGMDFWTDPMNRSVVQYGNGYFMDIGCSTIVSKPKTCINAERLSELGINLDMTFLDEYAGQNDIEEKQYTADGMITKIEIVDNESRSMFATLNHNGLQKMSLNKSIGYDFYKFKYLYPIEFEGRLRTTAPKYTASIDNGRKTTDNVDNIYITYRLGTDDFSKRFYYKNNGNRFPLWNNSFYFYFGVKEGNTAIDKFNKLFFTPCFKNKKYAFNVKVDETPAKWYTKNENCSDYDEEKLGKIVVSLDGISTPYTYTILDEFGEAILSDINCSEEELVFDKYFDINEKNCFFSDEDKKKPIINGNYSLIITDSKRNTVTTKIELKQNPIIASYNLYDLSQKFYQQQTTKGELCNCENQYFGNIVLTSFIVDGEVYYAKDAVNGNFINSNGDCTFEFGDGVIVEVTFAPLDKVMLTNNIEVETFSQCICLDCCEMTEEGFSIAVWIPMQYEMTVTQKGADCELIKNTSKSPFEIRNGKAFDMTINDVPYRFICGKYDNNVKFKINGRTDIKNSTHNGWFSVHDEKTYKFDEFSNFADNSQFWSEVISLEQVAEGNTELKLTDNDADKIAIYKLESLFNISQSTYVNSPSSVSGFSIGAIGGRKPLLYRLNYPDYYAFTGNETPQVKMQSYILDRGNYIDNDIKHPDVITYNYRYRNEDGYWTPLIDEDDKYALNSLFNKEEYLGNYAAIFTNDGGIEYSDNGFCSVKNKFNSAPKNCNPLPDQMLCTEKSIELSEIKKEVHSKNGTKQYNPYFRTLFLDRRFDYDIVLFTPFNVDNVISIEEGKFDWTKGRIFGFTYNGIEMAYEKTSEGVNVVGSDDLEYSIKYDDSKTNVPTIVYNEQNKKKFLKSVIKSGVQMFDITDGYWSKTMKKPEETKDIKSPDSLDLFFPQISDTNLSKLNDYFNQDNYPTIRYFDVAHIPGNNNFTYSTTPCTYEFEVSYDDNDNIKAHMYEGDETEFSVDCQNAITVKSNDLAECVTNGYGNVEYVAANDTCGTSMLVKGDYLTLMFNVREDSQNTTHSVSTKIPFIIAFKAYDGDENNDMLKLKTAQKDSDINNILKKIGNINVLNKPESLHVGKYDGWKYMMDSDNRIVEDSSTDFRQVLFGCTTVRYKFGPWVIEDDKRIRIGDNEFIAIILDRKYTNNEDDFLYKNLRVINTSNIYDVRPFLFECAESVVDIVVDDSTDIDFPTQEPDNGTEETPSEGGGAARAAEEAAEGGSKGGGANTKSQIITYRIKFPDEEKHNQAFVNYDDIEINVRYEVDSRSYVRSDIVLKKIDDTTLEFKVPWTGDMKNVFLKPNTETTVYMKMPNGLIYNILFYMRGESQSDNVICARY